MRTLKTTLIAGIFLSVVEMANASVSVFNGSISQLGGSPSHITDYVSASGQLALGASFQSNSVDGVAVQSVMLRITTTTGVYSFTSFATRTRANVDGATDYVLLGTKGAKDLLVINNIGYSGTVTGVDLDVNLASTSGFFSATTNEMKLMLLSQASAQVLASQPVATAPTEVTTTFNVQVTSTPIISTSAVQADSPTPAPADSPTPAPADSPTPAPAVSSTPAPAVSATPAPAVSATPAPAPADSPTSAPAVSPTSAPAASPSSSVVPTSGDLAPIGVMDPPAAPSAPFVLLVGFGILMALNYRKSKA